MLHVVRTLGRRHWRYTIQTVPTTQKRQTLRLASTFEPSPVMAATHGASGAQDPNASKMLKIENVGHRIMIEKCRLTVVGRLRNEILL